MRRLTLVIALGSSICVRPAVSQVASWVLDVQRAAEAGNPKAMTRLAAIYLVGEDLPQSWPMAEKWARGAAERGDATGMYLLATVYGGGPGVDRNLVWSFQWADLAIAHGCEAARDVRETMRTMMTPDEIAEAERYAWTWWHRLHPATGATGTGGDDVGQRWYASLREVRSTGAWERTLVCPAHCCFLFRGMGQKVTGTYDEAKMTAAVRYYESVYSSFTVIGRELHPNTTSRDGNPSAGIVLAVYFHDGKPFSFSSVRMIHGEVLREVRLECQVGPTCHFTPDSRAETFGASVGKAMMRDLTAWIGELERRGR